MRRIRIHILCKLTIYYIMKEDRIGVFVRVRPYQEKESASTFILSLNQTEIAVRDREREKEDLSFSFDHIFPVKASQQEVFETIGQPIVAAAFEGINGTIFAYGQTSSGKTYTCVGPDCLDPQERGLLPRSVSAIFSRIGESANFIEFRIKVSMVEIYMERIRDLLEPGKVDLKLRQNKARGIYIQDVTEEYVGSAEEAMKVFQRGVSNRAVAATNMNDVSSRSHMAFILTLHQNNLRDGSAKSAKLTVVDLAGSEKVSKTQAEGRVLDEAKQINKSLSSLGNVINALTDHKTNHVPYRDSKLTRLLQESLGGNSKTSLIINISPSAYNASESISSLRFGYRAKEIKNRPKVNKQYTIAELLVLLEKSEKRNQELEAILKELTASVSKKKSKENPYVENLLDSDNPLMSALSDNEHPPPPILTSRSKLSSLRKRFQSEAGEEEEIEENKQEGLEGSVTSRTVSVVGEKGTGWQEEIDKLRAQAVERAEEVRVLGEQLERVSEERVELSRQLDICRQRLQLVLKEARLNLMKLNAEKRENETLLQKYIKENIQNQEKDASITQLHSRIQDYEEKFLRLSHLQEEQAKKSKVFGVGADLAFTQQASRIIQQALGSSQHEETKTLAAESVELARANKELQIRVRDLEQEIKLYAHLEQAREELIKDKLKFMEERDRVYKDLQNRIEKVLELEERLDEEQEKRKVLEEIVSMDDSEKSRKIQSLQGRVHQLSEHYYVLKGQQSSWLKNNQKTEDKLAEQQRKIFILEGNNMDLRAEVESLRVRCEELEALSEVQSQLDVELQSQQEQAERRGNIVKVIRSDMIKE